MGSEQHIYENVFNTKFNLSFFRLKKDLCSLCESFKNSSDEQTENLKEKMETHRREITLSRQTKAEDKLLHGTGKHETVVCTFDLQATIPLPNGNISTFFIRAG